MADELKISITATDGASKVFEKVERSAQEMGDGIEDAAQKAGGEFKEMVQAAQQMSNALDRNAEQSTQSMTELGRSIDRLAASMDASLAGGARDAATALNTVETEAEQASTAVNQLDASAARTGASMRDFASAGQTVGQGLALIGASFTMYAGQARDHEQAVAALGRTYGDAAGQFVALADSMQSTTVFSNDQVIEAANLMGTLQRNYQMTSEEIQQLIQISADLAAVNGISLADASTRVAAAMRGEAESAEALGLTMNDAAIGIDQLGASATEAEKAQFRLAAITEQSAFAMGAAGDQAATTTGQVQQLANQVQDAATGFVGWTGPIGEVAAGLGSFGIEAGLAVGGLARLAQGFGQAASASGGFVSAVRSGTGVMGVLGRAGIVGALVGAGIAAIELSGIMEDDLANSFDQAEANASTLDLTIAQLTTTMDSAALALNLRAGNEALTEDLAMLQKYSDALAELDRLRNAPPSGIPGTDPRFAQWEADVAAAEATVAQYGETWGDVDDAIDDVNGAQTAMLAVLQHAGPGQAAALQTVSNLTDQYESGALTLDEYRNALDGVVADLYNYDTAALEATAATEAQTGATDVLSNAKFANNNVVRDSIEAMHQWAEASSLSTSSAEEQTTVIEDQTDALLDNVSAWDESIRAQNRAGTTILTQDEAATLDKWRRIQIAREEAFSPEQIDAFAASVEGVATASTSAAAGFASWLESAAPLNEALSSLFDRMEDAPQRMNELAVATERVARRQGGWTEELERAINPWTEFNALVIETVENVGLLDEPMERLRAGGVDTPALNLAIDTGGANQALDSTFGAVVGQTQAWGQLSQSVADWAGGLAHGSLAMTKLDQAFLNGLISQRTYGAALDANHEIQEANVSVQEDLLRIQIKQMPVIASLAQEQAAYIDTLADADETTQLVALGYMDMEKSAQAMSLAQLAANAALGGMQDVASSAITAAAEADPVLKAMLVDMGLISIGANGEIIVNFDEAVDADAAINELNSTLEDLITLLGNIFNVDTDTDASTTKLALDDLTAAALGIPKGPHNVATFTNAPDTTGKANALTAAINNIPRNVVTYITAVDNASFTAQQVASAINAIPLSRTVTINTVATGSTAVRLHGGPVDRFADGGVIASLAEAGPELLSFRGGGQALVPHPGIYMVEAGTSVLPAPATAARLDQASGGRGGNANYYGPVTQQITYDQSSFAQRRAGLQRIRG